MYQLIFIKSMHLQAWLSDLRTLNYSFRGLKNFDAPISVINERKMRPMAVCITGQANNFYYGAVPTLKELEKFVGSELDIFYYISTFKSLKSHVLDVKRFLPEFGIIYEDLEPLPNAPKKMKWRNEYQQNYALYRCFQMVHAWSVQYNILYRTLT